MRWLLLTLLEVAEGMAYLHRMSVVHCDLKPANVLLKSSNADVRGFCAKASPSTRTPNCTVLLPLTDSAAAVLY